MNGGGERGVSDQAASLPTGDEETKHVHPDCCLHTLGSCALVATVHGAHAALSSVLPIPVTTSNVDWQHADCDVVCCRRLATHADSAGMPHSPKAPLPGQGSSLKPSVI